MRFIKTSVFLVVTTLSLSLCNAQEKIKIDGVTAVVGDKIILDSDIGKYKKELENRAETLDVTDCQILEDIMTQKLLAHHAVIDSVLVSDAEVDANVQRTLTHFKSQLGTMDKVVSLYGFDDEDDLTFELKRIEKENLLTQRERESLIQDVVVTPEEVRYFYEDLKKQDGLPNFGVVVQLSQITIGAIPSKEAVTEVVDKLNEIKKQVENGYSMRLKAILYSEDPGVAQNGGMYTITRESQFVKEFKEAAFSIEEGEISEPFKSMFGYHILQVEKIKGQQRQVRHLLMQPKIDQTKLSSAKAKLEAAKAEIIAQEITFENAVRKYSDDKDTRLNKGKLVNPYTNDANFELNKMDSELFARIDKLNEGDVTDPFYEETREGLKHYKMIQVVQKTPAHTADFVKDYVKIQQLALQKKQEETITKWYKSKIKETYIKLNGKNKDCKLEYNWINN